jgi:riboflavin biosynthesis pyrimidine reductase
VAPTIALVTRSANLNPDSPVFTEALVRTVVITCDIAPAENRESLAQVADVIIAGDDAVDLTAAFDDLRERGLARILAEGGPHLLGDVANFGLLDQLALSISPTIAGGTAGRILQTEAVLLQDMGLASLLEDSGFLFALYERATHAKAIR